MNKILIIYDEFKMYHSVDWVSIQNINLPPSLYPWLTDRGSFMQRLKTNFVTNPSVKIIRQEYEEPEWEEKKILINPGKILAREVLISSQSFNWMYARTVFLEEALLIDPRFTHLKNQPLGSILFSDSGWQREEFEVACLTQKTMWFQKIYAQVTFQSEQLWARRSVFSFQNKKLLLLTEVFLPDIRTLNAI